MLYHNNSNVQFNAPIPQYNFPNFYNQIPLTQFNLYDKNSNLNFSNPAYNPHLIYNQPYSAPIIPQIISTNCEKIPPEIIIDKEIGKGVYDI